MTRAAALTFLFLACGIVRAADPELTPIQPPQVAVAGPESMTFIRQSMYDRWQFYGVDRGGYFRPRVVLNFPEPYYLVNGKPYPLLSVRQRDFIPYVTD